MPGPCNSLSVAQFKNILDSILSLCRTNHNTTVTTQLFCDLFFALDLSRMETKSAQINKSARDHNMG